MQPARRDRRCSAEAPAVIAPLEVEHRDAAAAGYAQCLPGSVVEQARAVEISIGSPAEDDGRRAHHVHTEDLVSVAGEPILLGGRKLAPSRVESRGELACSGAWTVQHGDLRLLRPVGHIKGIAFEVRPGQVELDRATLTTSASVEGLVCAGRETRPQHPPAPSQPRGDRLDHPQRPRRGPPRADARIRR